MLFYAVVTILIQQKNQEKNWLIIDLNYQNLTEVITKVVISFVDH